MGLHSFSGPYKKIFKILVEMYQLLEYFTVWLPRIVEIRWLVSQRCILALLYEHREWSQRAVSHNISKRVFVQYSWREHL